MISTTDRKDHIHVSIFQSFHHLILRVIPPFKNASAFLNRSYIHSLLLNRQHLLESHGLHNTNLHRFLFPGIYIYLYSQKQINKEHKNHTYRYNSVSFSGCSFFPLLFHTLISTLLWRYSPTILFFQIGIFAGSLDIFPDPPHS